MKDLTQDFGNLYHPVKALLIYQKDDRGYQNEYYVESYDVDRNGCPVNAHPLSVAEGGAFAKALQVSELKAQGFLTPKGLMPAQVLHLNSADGFVLWHTPAQTVKLLFTENLGIACGDSPIPALVWKAGRGSLRVFALTETEPSAGTGLYNAPFFNIYKDGRVCMGNVKISIPKDCGLEQFMALWQDYFFNSYFSHLIDGHQPLKGNIVQLWQGLTGTAQPFPEAALRPTKFQIQDLIR